LRAYLIAPARQIKEFYLSVAIQQLGYGLINIFEPVYLYQLGVSPVGIMLYYVTTYVPYLLLIPLGGRFAKRFGYEHALAVGTFFNISYFGALASIPFVPEMVYAAPLLLCLQKTFYWPAYHANFARFSGRREVGREVGTMQVLTTVASGVGPIIGGFVAQYVGFGVLFVIAVGVLVVSVVPLFTTKEVFVPTDLTWREQWRYLLAPSYRRRLIGSFGFGSEYVGVVIWPLFVFLVLGSTAELGIVAGVATAVAAGVTLLLGRITDRSKRAAARVFFWTNVVHAASWLVRPFVRTFVPVVAADSVGFAARTATYVPYYGAVYGDAKRKNHIMIEVVGAEMALIIGKVVTMLACLVVLQLTGSLPATFGVGFVASLFFFLFR